MGKKKRFSVRVAGQLVQQSFSNASDGKAWQQTMRRLSDRARAGLEDEIAPCLIETHAADFLQGRTTKGGFRHEVYRLGQYILPLFQGQELHRIKKEHWQQLFGKTGSLIQEHGLSPATHNRIRTLCHTMYEAARKDYAPPRADKNPISDIAQLEETPGEIQWLRSKADIQAYIAASFSDALIPCFGIYTILDLNTGLRQGNVMGLKWEDIDFDSGLIHVRRKWQHNERTFVDGSKGTSQSRSLGMTEAVRSALLEWRQTSQNVQGCDFVCSLRDGSHLTDKMVWRANLRALKRAGLPYMKPHAIRHTYASHYLAAGGSIYDLKIQLGHSSVTVTEKYAHTAPDMIRARSQVLDIGPVKPASVIQLKQGKK